MAGQHGRRWKERYMAALTCPLWVPALERDEPTAERELSAIRRGARIAVYKYYEHLLIQ